MNQAQRLAWIKTQQFPTFPHCDAKALHAPGKCEYCDMHPEWQLLRIVYDIAFTDDQPEDKQLPDPASHARPEYYRAWYGNVAKAPVPGHSRCSRCFKDIKLRHPDAVGTEGYYEVGNGGEWAKYARRGESLICDTCMWTDPEYIKVYGAHK